MLEPATLKLRGNVSSRSLRRLKLTLAVVLSSAVAFSSYLVAHDMTLRQREKTLRAERRTTRRSRAIEKSANEFMFVNDAAMNSSSMLMSVNTYDVIAA